jgi:hypothetical protein
MTLGAKKIGPDALLALDRTDDGHIGWVEDSFSVRAGRRVIGNAA